MPTEPRMSTSQYIEQYGNVRMTPLMQSVAAQNAASVRGGDGPRAHGASGNGGGGGSAGPLPPPPSLSQWQGGAGLDVAKLQQAAQGGDLDAMRILEYIGGAAAAGGGAYALYRALRGRGGGADGATAPVPVDEVSSGGKLVPHVTQLQDEHLVPRPAGYLGGDQRRLTHQPPTLPAPQPKLNQRPVASDNVPGPTQRQMQEDIAYGQRDVQNSAPKVELARAIAARKAARMQAASEALRAITHGVR